MQRQTSKKTKLCTVPRLFKKKISLTKFTEHKELNIVRLKLSKTYTDKINKKTINIKSVCNRNIVNNNSPDVSNLPDLICVDEICLSLND